MTGSRMTRSRMRRSLVRVMIPRTVNIHFFSVRAATSVVRSTSRSRCVFLISGAPRSILELIRKNIPVSGIGVKGVRCSRKGARVCSAISISSTSGRTFHGLGRRNIGLRIHHIPSREPSSVCGFLWKGK